MRAEYPNQLDYSGVTCDAVIGAGSVFLLPDMTPAGLEPAIPGSVGRCLIHWATGPLMVPRCRVAFAAVVALHLVFVVPFGARSGLVTSVCASIAQLVRA